MGKTATISTELLSSKTGIVQSKYINQNWNIVSGDIVRIIGREASLSIWKSNVIPNMFVVVCEDFSLGYTSQYTMTIEAIKDKFSLSDELCQKIYEQGDSK